MGYALAARLKADGCPGTLSTFKPDTQAFSCFSCISAVVLD